MNTLKLSLFAVLAALVLPAAAQAADRNHDGLPDRWEHRYHLSLRIDQSGRDQDRDGLRNRGEFDARTSPRSADTDHDGLGDAAEAAWDHIDAYQQTAGYGGPPAHPRPDRPLEAPHLREKGVPPR